MSVKDHPNSAPGFPAMFPSWWTRLQAKYLNSVVRRVARFLPLAVIRHRGRKSGSSYETMVTAHRKGDILAVLLVHGMSDWAKNVLSAGEADVQMRGHNMHIVNPRVLPAGSADSELPQGVWPAKGRLGVFVADIAAPN